MTDASTARGGSLPDVSSISFDKSARRLVQIMKLVEQMIDDPSPSDDDIHVVQDLLSACWECRRQLERAAQDSANQSDLVKLVDQLEQITRRHEHWSSGSSTAISAYPTSKKPDVAIAAPSKLPPPPTVTREEIGTPAPAPQDYGGSFGKNGPADYGGSFGKPNSSVHSVHSYVTSLVGSFGGSFGISSGRRDPWFGGSLGGADGRKIETPEGRASPAPATGLQLLACCGKGERGGTAVEEVNTFEPINQLPERESTGALFSGFPSGAPTAKRTIRSPEWS